MITEINVTPLVDIMLVLLIIFMVTASLIVRESLEVNLPEASTSEQRNSTMLMVTLDRAGKLFFNSAEISPNRFREQIRNARKQTPKLEAVIAADKETSHGRVVEIIDLLREEGVTRFAINVLKKER